MGRNFGTIFHEGTMPADDCGHFYPNLDHGGDFDDYGETAAILGVPSI